MRDCENVELRDLLPELLNERLAGAERERVLAHVDACAECAAEWALLRGARAGIHAAAPRVDAAAVARAVSARLAAERGVTAAPPLRLVQGNGQLPARPAGTPTHRPVRRWFTQPLQAAAAVVVLALGAGGVLFARRGAEPLVARPDTVASVVGQTVSPAVPVAAARETASAPATPSSVKVRPDNRPALVAAADVPASALGATFDDLSDEELAAVLKVVDAESTLPAAEPLPTPDVIPDDLDPGARP